MNAKAKLLFATVRMGYAKLRDWLRNRSSRERVLLLAGSGALGVWMLLGVVILPLDAWREDQQRAAGAWESRLEWLRTQPRTQSQTELRPGVLTSSTGDCGPDLLRINQEGAGILVSVQEQSFACLLDWLLRLEKDHGIQVDQLRLQEGQQEGAVTGTLRFVEA